MVWVRIVREMEIVYDGIIEKDGSRRERIELDVKKDDLVKGFVFVKNLEGVKEEEGVKECVSEKIWVEVWKEEEKDKDKEKNTRW